ncbi:hypothetical protein GXP67_22210 [Rhodocytophaga rosea]|uniref:DUF3784 domain-containing protein n=1 Tax=Rhodocytophaga rosea TaxID=2704465 RepID=A0A6C0GM66_9BACT|nr:hypothetical protein [Rhodocytophaga rosea]QHT69161.1 hypothetical protein GXP67_22210 [Rhodocytophaga rosea]
MESTSIILVVMISWCGVLCLLIGYLFKQNQSIEIISFPNLFIDKVKDKEAFSRFIGNRIMLIGVVALLTSAGIGVFPQFVMLTILLFILLGVLILTELAIKKNRYLL